MPKAKSLTGRTETVRRWRVRVDGRVEDVHGHLHDELPVEIAYSPQAVDLALRGYLEIEGVSPSSPAPKSKLTPEVEKPVPPPVKFNKKQSGGK